MWLRAPGGGLGLLLMALGQLCAAGAAPTDCPLPSPRCPPQDWVLYLSPEQQQAADPGTLAAVQAAAAATGLPLTGARAAVCDVLAAEEARRRPGTPCLDVQQACVQACLLNN